MKAIYLVTALLALINGITSHDCSTRCRLFPSKKVLLLVIDPITNVASFKCLEDLAKMSSKDYSSHQAEVKRKFPDQELASLHHENLVNTGSMLANRLYVMRELLSKELLESQPFTVYHTEALLRKVVAGMPANDNPRINKFTELCNELNSQQSYGSIKAKLENEYNSLHGLMSVNMVLPLYTTPFQNDPTFKGCYGPYLFCLQDLMNHREKLTTEFQKNSCALLLQNVAAMKQMEERESQQPPVSKKSRVQVSVCSVGTEIAGLDDYFANKYEHFYEKSQSSSSAETHKVSQKEFNHCRMLQQYFKQIPQEIKKLKDYFGLVVADVPSKLVVVDASSKRILI